MEPLTGIPQLDEVLSRLTSIQSRDEHDAVMEELFRIAPNHVEALNSLYDLGTYQNMSLVWCLIGQTSEQAMALFSKAIKDKDQYTRWAAAKALSEFRTRDASSLLVAALKDRSHLVKLTAVDAMSTFRDPQAVPQLEKICASKHLQKNAPGIVSSAKKALRICRRAR
ncbi:MAG: HEAT repeat domain-containing protein [Pseudomonadales bacterium]